MKLRKQLVHPTDLSKNTDFKNPEQILRYNVDRRGSCVNVILANYVPRSFARVHVYRYTREEAKSALSLYAQFLKLPTKLLRSRKQSQLSHGCLSNFVPLRVCVQVNQATVCRSLRASMQLAERLYCLSWSLRRGRVAQWWLFSVLLLSLFSAFASNAGNWRGRAANASSIPGN